MSMLLLTFRHNTLNFLWK